MQVPAEAFLGLQRVSETRFSLPLPPALSGGGGSLFGGVGLAAGMAALAQAVEKPLVWSTGQFLSLTQGMKALTVDVSLPAVGRHVTQGQVQGRHQDQSIFTVLGALGQRPEAGPGTWVDRPEAPAPESCPRIDREHREETLHHAIELRRAKGMFGFSQEGEPSGCGRNLLWARMPGYSIDAVALAIIADYMPSVLGDALEGQIFCTSLDNTLRLGQLRPTEWVLCDNRMTYTEGGFGYGTGYLWSESGHLLATATQSMIVRRPPAAAVAAG